MNIRRRPSWLRVTGVSLAIFFTVLALLWFRVSAGEDPVLGAGTSQVTTTTTGATTTSSDDTSSDDASSSSSSSDIPTTSAS